MRGFETGLIKSAALIIAAFTVLLFLILAVRGCLIARRQAEAPGRTITVLERETDTLLTLPLEEYVVLCTAAEMPAGFHEEALAAQAVAARTYAVRRLMGYTQSCGAGDVCTESGCCQAYSSPAELRAQWGHDYEENFDKVSAAVYRTQGLIAVYGGEPIEALYHSCSGGRTEDAKNVFSGDAAYLVGVDSPGEEGASHYEDTVRFSLREFEKKVNAALRAELQRDKLSEQVEILSRYESGRVKKVRLGEKSATGRELRGILGLYSANFSIDISKNEVVISTRGYGHGVGLSQYGANAMANTGCDFYEILSHYYTGVEIAGFE